MSLTYGKVQFFCSWLGTGTQQLIFAFPTNKLPTKTRTVFGSWLPEVVRTFYDWLSSDILHDICEVEFVGLISPFHWHSPESSIDGKLCGKEHGPSHPWRGGRFASGHHGRLQRSIASRSCDKVWVLGDYLFGRKSEIDLLWAWMVSAHCLPNWERLGNVRFVVSWCE